VNCVHLQHRAKSERDRVILNSHQSLQNEENYLFIPLYALPIYIPSIISVITIMLIAWNSCILNEMFLITVQKKNHSYHNESNGFRKVNNCSKLYVHPKYWNLYQYQIQKILSLWLSNEMLVLENCTQRKFNIGLGYLLGHDILYSQ